MRCCNLQTSFAIFLGKSYLTGQSRQIIASLTGQSRQIIASLTGLSRQIICYLTGPYNQKSGLYYKVYSKIMASLTVLSNFAYLCKHHFALSVRNFSYWNLKMFKWWAESPNKKNLASLIDFHDFKYFRQNWDAFYFFRWREPPVDRSVGQSCFKNFWKI